MMHRRTLAALAISFVLAGCAKNAPAPATPRADDPAPPSPLPAPAAEPKQTAIVPANEPQAAESAPTEPSDAPPRLETAGATAPAESPSTSDVSLTANLILVRKHPVLVRIGPILKAGLNDLAGSSVPLDPLGDVEWFSLFGPSLAPTNHDVVIAHYDASEEVVNKAVAALVRSYDKGGPYDVGVPGVKASLGYADHGQRVFLQLPAKLLAVVPPPSAHDTAVALRKQQPPRPAASEALRLVLRKPSQQLPARFRTPSLREVRLWASTNAADGSADLYGEGDCGDTQGAIDMATHLADVIRRANSGIARMMTRGILNGATVATDGSKATLHLHATPEQLHAVVNLVASIQGVTLPASGGPPAAPSSR